MEHRNPKREREKKRVVYGVFETFAIADADDIDQDEYLIYKLDVDSLADDGVGDLGKPIHTLKLNDYPLEMSVFSSGSIIYFIGGFKFDEEFQRVKWTNKAYMLDVSSSSSSSSSAAIPIQSMASPKPFPLVFGPVNHHKFYVFSGNGTSTHSFEMLDTLSNTWTTLTLPSFFSKLRIEYACSLLWDDTDILLSNSANNRLLAYSTENDKWRIILDHQIPFINPRPLFSRKDTCYVILAMDGLTNLPVPYMSVVNHEKDLGPFQRLDEVVGLADITLKQPQLPNGLRSLQNFFTFKDDYIDYICIVRGSYRRSFGNPNEHGPEEDAQHIIDICNFTYTFLESTKVKEIKIDNSWKFKYCKKMALTPKWFFAV